MNEFRAYAHPVHGGFHAMVRLAHNAKAEPVKAKGGNPIVYVSELDAHKAATAHLEAYFNGDLRRDGAKIEATRAADALFNLPASRSKTVRQSKTKRLVEVMR